MPTLVERGLERMHVELPVFFAREDPHFVAVSRRSYDTQLHFILDGLGERRPVDAVEPPPVAIEEARLSADRGVPVAALAQCYRIAHRLLFDAVLEHVDRSVVPALRAETLRIASDWLFAYFDWIVVRTAEEHERERAALTRDSGRRRRELVRALLDGRPVETGTLGHRLDVPHVGLVAWGEEPRAALQAAGAATELELLVVADGDRPAWGWLSGDGAADRAALRRRLAAAQLPEATFLAVGAPAEGIDGFRATHAEALAASGVAREAGGGPLTFHDDVALLTLALRDPRAARAFAERELGPLAGADKRSATLRATLAAYFAAGHNAVAAAATLGVHERTVVYRLRTIEERLGRPLLGRREELGIALRLAPIVLDDVTPR